MPYFRLERIVTGIEDGYRAYDIRRWVAMSAVDQIRAAQGAHNDPICTPGLMIAEDPPSAQSGGPGVRSNELAHHEA